MSVAAATRKLGSLVKGQLLGIRVTEHGLSPRIIQAQVVGTKGRSTVSGDRLQRIFDLPTTFASFTVISSAASGGALTGTVSTSAPAPNGAVALQAWSKASWHTLTRAPLRGGLEDYSVHIPRSARYRVTYGQFRGPALFAVKPKPLPRPQLLVAAMGGSVPAWVSVYAGKDVWPAARDRRTVRPLPLVLRTP